ncbi:hypothetical protein DAEQUDRAFT_288680 [Daedalea quercina L-15889]|uniref:Uncharacterized protein n=1 Tax=Daedalea quercina L-15889 TaxID=1314783 RepID=A0A165TX48_9APHY|nr:hypothetical protein DAEQUDRAFT_288680 [Daedalea quercina L-15889]
MWGSQDNDQSSIRYPYDPHAEFPWDLRGFEEVPAYQNAQQPFLIYNPTEHLTSQLFAFGGNVTLPQCPDTAHAYPHPVLRAPSSSPNYSLLSLSPPTPSPTTAFTGSLPTSPDPVQRPLPSPPIPRLRVPQTIRSTPISRDTVQFEVGGSPGIRMCDLLSDRAQLDAGAERVLEHTGVRQIHLVITWPGYPQSGKYIHVQEDGLFVTRERLAKLVCHQVQFFVRSAKRKNSHARGSRQWSIGNNGIQWEDLWLLSVFHDGNIWRPEIEVHVRAT